MKKLFSIKNVLLLSLTILASSANAQIRYGIKAGLGINTPKFNKEVVHVENLNSFSAGPTIDVSLPIIDLGLDASLLYSNDKINAWVDGAETKSSVQKITNHYIELPVNLKYRMFTYLPVNAYVAAGPYARFLISGNNFSSFNEKITTKKFETGINIGLGASILNQIEAGLCYSIKLSDNYGADSPQWKEALNGKSGTFFLNVAVLF